MVIAWIKQNWGVAFVLASGMIIAALLFVFLQPREPNLPTYQYGESRTANHQPGGRGCEPIVLATIANRIKALAERDRCAEAAEEYRLKSNDLVQQARTADATAEQTYLTLYLARIGLLGAIGGLLTLIAASLAAYFARDAAYAAHGSLKAFTEVERARLIVVPSGLTHSPRDGNKCGVSIKATNVGKGTCVVTRFAHTFVEGSEFSRVKFYMGAVPDPITIVPNESKSLVGWAECRDFKVTPFVRGVVTYKDAFSERKTFFCFQIFVEDAGRSDGRWWREIRDKDQLPDT
jgi:hypothetical protein